MSGRCTGPALKGAVWLSLFITNACAFTSSILSSPSTASADVIRKHYSKTSSFLVEGRMFQPFSARFRGGGAFSSSAEPLTTASTAPGRVVPKIIISGAPASGKGTQCELLKERYGLIHLSTGDMLREAVKKGTSIGKLAKGYMDKGLLVPDDVLIDMVQARLKEKDCCECGWILDGFPRTQAQAGFLKSAGIHADCFILLNVPDELLITRAVGRRIDPVTGDIYHMAFNPPPAEITDRLVHRSDDTEEKVKSRLVAYHTHVQSVRDSFKDVLQTVDGTQPKKVVHSAITSILDKTLTVRKSELAFKEPQNVPQLFIQRPVFRNQRVSFDAVLKDKLPEGAVIIPTEPVKGMKPGTSGLRKKVAVVKEGLYLHNFVQSIFDVLPSEELQGSTLLVSGDGRYYNRDALQTIIKIAAANNVGRIWVGQGGLMSTPAASATIRTRENGVAYGGLVLTASHNPGGPDEDFGIKFNTANGAPASETLTDKIYDQTLKINRIKMMESTPDVDLDKIGTTMVGSMVVEIISPTEDYMKVLKEQFDFELLKRLIARPDFSFTFDAMHGVAGAYAKQLFVDELGASTESLMRDAVKEDFGGDHPDPNLTYAVELVKKMGLNAEGIAWPYTEMNWIPPQFGAASDGDADRNMILGHRFFVTPSDSVAVIAANADAIPYFAKNGGLKGVARSMPTSGALDRVAQDKGFKFFETPTGWKFFGNLMDSGLLGGANYSPFLCGEESFGTGSDHIREKDGIWAVLAWLSILAKYNSDPSKPFVTVEDIVRKHWQTYGRNFYARYDYETVDLEAANNMMQYLRELKIKDGDVVDGFALSEINEFEYTDPVDGSQVSQQGIRILFKDGSRVVFRLSGTGSVGATIRVYIEKYEPDVAMHFYASQPYVRSLAEAGIKLSKLKEFTGRESPTVIT